MDKVIKINIYDKEDLFEIYNDELISESLIAYLIKEATYIERKDKIKIVIYNKANLKIDIEEKIKEGLKREYLNIIIDHQKNNLIQFFLFVIGVLFLFISTLYTHLIWHDVLVIIGWVPIWEMVDIEIFTGINGKRLKRVLKRLLDSKFITK